MAQVTDRLFTTIPASTGQSDQMEGLSGVTDKVVAVFGTFVGTAQVQGSIDWTTFVDIGSSVTAAALIEISTHVKELRIDVTAYTSGAIEASLLGLDQKTA